MGKNICEIINFNLFCLCLQHTTTPYITHCKTMGRTKSATEKSRGLPAKKGKASVKKESKPTKGGPTKLLAKRSKGIEPSAGKLACSLINALNSAGAISGRRRTGTQKREKRSPPSEAPSWSPALEPDSSAEELEPEAVWLGSQ